MALRQCDEHTSFSDTSPLLSLFCNPHACELNSIKWVVLQKKFEGTILPKIKDQIASLDQQDNPNQAMIELRRELTVRTCGQVAFGSIAIEHVHAVHLHRSLALFDGPNHNLTQHRPSC